MSVASSLDHELTTIALRDRKARSRISTAKIPLLSAVQEIIETNRPYWPLSVRQIHYRLLNLVPLCHAAKPDSAYQNTSQCYHNQCIDICGRGRPSPTGPTGIPPASARRWLAIPPPWPS